MSTYYAENDNEKKGQDFSGHKELTPCEEEKHSSMGILFNTDMTYEGRRKDIINDRTDQEGYQPGGV